jgi:hypothetical protein
MKLFKVNKNITIVCETASTRNGFKHTATLMLNGNEVETVKINYLNRTWESFEYQSVLSHLVDKSKVMTDKQLIACAKFIANGARVDDELQPLKTVAGVMALGDLFGQNQKEQNDWKTRMLKAGLEDKGLIMPDDWDQLDENTKTARLNAVIESIK